MAQVKTTASNSMTTERRVNAPRERVFAVWTEPEQIRKWWGGSGDVAVERAEVDLRVGGAFLLRMRGLDSGNHFQAEGTYSEVEPPARLVHSWAWTEGSPFAMEDTRVTVEFIEDGSGTIVRITHEKFPSAEIAGRHHEGWDEKLAALGDYFDA